MKTEMKCTDPDNIPFTMSITMDVCEWKILDAALQESGTYSYPVTKLRDQIRVVLRKVTTVFDAEMTKD